MVSATYLTVFWILPQLSLFAGLTTSSRQCYYADGSAAPVNYLPCGNVTSGANSPCCNSDHSDICMSSGFCVSPNPEAANSLIWASGCTDWTGKDQNCQQYCTGKCYVLYGIDVSTTNQRSSTGSPILFTPALFERELVL